MATPTYTPIASITLGSSASSVTFSSISADYRDLIFVWTGTQSVADDFRIYLNSDTGTNYSFVRARADGTDDSSESGSGESGLKVAAGTFGSTSSVIVQLMDYSATDKHKTALVRSNSNNVAMLASRWADTSAITSVKAETESGNFSVGSTFSIYGIAK
jgi:hypothetical protein